MNGTGRFLSRVFHVSEPLTSVAPGSTYQGLENPDLMMQSSPEGEMRRSGPQVGADDRVPGPIILEKRVLGILVEPSASCSLTPSSNR